MRKPIWLKILIWFGFSALCLIGLAAGTALSVIKGSPVMIGIIQNRPPAEVFKSDSVNLLVLGCDEVRSPQTGQILKQQGRSDSILVARLDFKTKQITGASVPRDLYVKLDEWKQGHKLNAYYAYGGPELSKYAVEQVLGIHIDRIAVIDYKAFQKMVDLVGGVTLTVQKDLKYTDTWGQLFIDLKKGRQTLDGYNSMCFVRYRKDSDLMRQERQRDFSVAFKQALFSHPWKVPAVADQLVNVLGGEMTPAEVAAMINFGRSVDQKNIKLGQIPVRESGRNSSFLYLDKDQLQAKLRELNLVPMETASVSN